MCVLFLLKSFSQWVLYKSQQFCSVLWPAIAMYMSEGLYFINFQCPGAGLEKNPGKKNTNEKKSNKKKTIKPKKVHLQVVFFRLFGFFWAGFLGWVFFMPALSWGIKTKNEINLFATSRKYIYFHLKSINFTHNL